MGERGHRLGGARRRAHVRHAAHQVLDVALLGDVLGSAGARRRAVVRVDEVVEATRLAVLHLQKPVQLPLHLVEHVGLAVAALGDVRVVAEDVRKHAVGIEQVHDRGGRERRVLAVVARVVPALRHVPDGAGRAHAGGHVGGVAEAAGEALGERLLDGDALALVEEVAHRVAQRRLVEAPADLERRRGVDASRVHHHVVLAGPPQSAEVRAQHFLARHELLEGVDQPQRAAVGDGVVHRAAHLEPRADVGGERLGEVGDVRVLLAEREVAYLVHADGGRARLAVWRCELDVIEPERLRIRTPVRLAEPQYPELPRVEDAESRPRRESAHSAGCGRAASRW